MTVIYAREMVQDLWEELLPLSQRHWEEIAKYKDIPLSPDIETYNKVEILGRLRCYTARKDGVLIGYAWFFVNYNLHYQESLQAVQDVVFLAPEHRKGRIGLQLLRFADEQLKKDGVQVISHHVKKDHPQLGSLLEFMGYEVMDIVYSRRIY